MKTNEQPMLVADLPLTPEEVKNLFYSPKGWEKRFQSESNKEHPLQPDIGVETAAVLRFLKPMLSPQRALDLGTCLGFSARVLAELVGPEGEVITVERDAQLADRAEANLAADDLGKRVRVLRGDARKILKSLDGTFDLILLDLDKPLYTALLDDILNLLRQGGYLIADDIDFLSMDLPFSVKHYSAGIADFVNHLLKMSELETIYLPLGDGITISRKLV